MCQPIVFRRPKPFYVFPFIFNVQAVCTLISRQRFEVQAPYHEVRVTVPILGTLLFQCVSLPSQGTSLPVDDHTSWAIVLERKGLVTQTAPPLCSRLPDTAVAGVGSLGEVPGGTPKHILGLDWWIETDLIVSLDTDMVQLPGPNHVRILTVCSSYQSIRV